jgi:hypothetical protein
MVKGSTALAYLWNGFTCRNGGVLSNANIGFEFGQRGTQNEGLIKEDFFSISMNSH